MGELRSLNVDRDRMIQIITEAPESAVIVLAVDTLHRTLWDDRHPPECEYVTDPDNASMRCRIVEDSWHP